jgi:glucose/arabinose dehydrogenase
MYRNLAAAAAVISLVVLGVTLLAVAPWSDDSQAGEPLQGDIDCSDEVDTSDALWDLRFIAAIPPYPECLPRTGDVDCNGMIEAADVTGILAYVAEVSNLLPQGGPGCPEIGEPVPDPTAPPSPSPSPTLAPTPTATLVPTLPPTPPPTPTASPVPEDYGTTPILSPNYLGDANNALIEFALIPGEPDQAIVASQEGHIYRVSLSGAFPPDLWGDLSGLADSGGEEGLLSVAFSPTFTDDDRVYAYYTPGCNDPCLPTVLARFQATVDDLNEQSHEILLQIEDFAGNHNGGHIAFDSANYLYLSLGDGGGGSDPQETAQDRSRLLGKVLRLDVSGESGYAIPSGNPFNDGSGPLREEIFAYGFRNPWRMTIDPFTDNVWLGDVGQGRWEEANRVIAGGNYGWDCYEGFQVYESEGCGQTGFQFPRAAHDHGNGRQAITGGVVYRGDDMPELYGWYVYGDFYSGEVFALDTTSDSPPIRLFDSDMAIASFTLLADGEVAIVTYGDGVLRLTG